MTDNETPVPDSVQHVPASTTPTWETELLISAALIFGTGAMLVVMALFSLLVTVGSILIATAISSLVFGGEHGEKLFFATMTLLVVPLALGGAIDRLFGHRLAPAGWPARAMR